MPHLDTETVTRHMLALTDEELQALREAARLALQHAPDANQASHWRVLSRLGLSPTRSAPQAHPHHPAHP